MNLANRPPLGLKQPKPKKDPKHLARVAELPSCKSMVKKIADKGASEAFIRAHANHQGDDCIECATEYAVRHGVPLHDEVAA